MGAGGQCHAPADLLPAKTAGTHYTLDWAGTQVRSRRVFFLLFYLLAIRLHNQSII